jgi:hypothetical protein
MLWLVELRLAKSLDQQMNAGAIEDGERVRLLVVESSGHVLVMEQCRKDEREIERLVERMNAY